MFPRGNCIQNLSFALVLSLTDPDERKNHFATIFQTLGSNTTRSKSNGAQFSFPSPFSTPLLLITHLLPPLTLTHYTLSLTTYIPLHSLTGQTSPPTPFFKSMSASSSWRSRNEDEDEDLDDNILTDAQEVQPTCTLSPGNKKRVKNSRSRAFRKEGTQQAYVITSYSGLPYPK